MPLSEAAEPPIAEICCGLDPVEVHCHGLGDVDFSEFSSIDLVRLEKWCEAEGVLCVPTMYLHRDLLDDFEIFVRRYHQLRENGELPHIIAIALEGPLLASHGGTPAATVWAPGAREWERLAALGQHGLAYTVLSPDAFSAESALADTTEARETGFEKIIPLLQAHGVRPAIGHFLRTDPQRSADAVDGIVEMCWASAWSGAGARVLTDHLFNDMPLTIRHAFRTTRAKSQRDELIASYDLPGWRLDSMTEIAGPVPAAIMRHAAAGRLSACINFDGEHVDLAIAARATQLMGAANAMIMTDRCDSARLGGQNLRQGDENGLWYQEAGIVAAGSVPLARQAANALRSSLVPVEVSAIVAGTAHRALGIVAEAVSGAEHAR